MELAVMQLISQVNSKCRQQQPHQGWLPIKPDMTKSGVTKPDCLGPIQQTYMPKTAVVTGANKED